ncbi:glutaminyl-peptide cyclotransferase [Phenylobacterium sp.]|uniref:glutaminyl-peptide cyclotransferase n=1 Tax=Phenylobacterium sp. TaxID=1871053 RepID=UPI00272781E8|nr:glutaminyl-peptide cyclotransferase [Phenylobacterium sp.]MDO8379443.1 glutaminyl-peptide cyclotransferase [Phenylobacterium sp.]
MSFLSLKSVWFALAAFAAVMVGSPAAAVLPVQGYEVRATYPHDTGAFTEGLFYLDGVMFESTGIEGRSSIRKVRLRDGAVLQSVATDPDKFGEGIVNWGSEILSLTWRDEIGYRWDLKTFARKGSFRYPGEGWSLTQDGKSLIMSDGTPFLRFLDPRTLRETRRVRVTAAGRPVVNLNELEWVKGEILANIWMTNRIARIDPATGAVKGWIDLTGLPETLSRRDPDAVPNGIAYDRQGDRLFVTGKNWPHLYEIVLKPLKAAAK